MYIEVCCKHLLPQQSSFQKVLKFPASVQDAMNEHLPAFNFVYYAIGLEMNFQISIYIYSRQFRRNMSSFREMIQAVAELLDFFEYMIGRLS